MVGQLVRIVSVASAMVGIAFGVFAGIFLSARCFRGIPGFSQGAIIGGLFTFLGSMMTGLIIAGRAEERLGTAIGVPVGLGIGCFLGAFVANSVAGVLGAVIARLFR